MTSRPCTSLTTKPKPSAAGRVAVCLTMRSGLKRPTRNDAPVVVRGGTARRRCVRTISKAKPGETTLVYMAFVA